MKSSNSIGMISKAIAAAQGELENVTKDGKANYGKYATLAAVLEEIRPALSKNGVAITQWPETTENGHCLTTVLSHAESGEWMSGELLMSLDRPTMQSLGSAITYARRYAASAAVGIFQEDDDGQQASIIPLKQQQPVKNQDPAPLPNYAQNQNPNVPKGVAQKPEGGITEIQASSLWTLAKLKKLKDEQVLSLLKNIGGVQKTTELKADKYEEIIKKMSEM